MLNIYWAMGIFLLILIVAFFSYIKNAEKLIVYSKYSIIVDILAWIGGIILIVGSTIYYDVKPEYNYLLWIQFVVGAGHFNIHLARFLIHLKTKDKFYYSRKGRRY